MKKITATLRQLSASAENQSNPEVRRLAGMIAVAIKERRPTDHPLMKTFLDRDMTRLENALARDAAA